MSSVEKEICCKLFNFEKWIPEFEIDTTKRAALCFRESLLICLKKGSATDAKPIGGYCILVEPIGPQGHELLVQVQSSMSMDGHFGGSKVISSATEKFHCLEEKRTEFVYKDDGMHEKTIFIGVEDDFYHVNITRTCPCNKSTESKDLSFCCYNRFISEGINVLLMRYLAITNYVGSLSLESITIDGDITTSNYDCTAAEHMELGGNYLSVYTIARKMHKEDGTEHNIRTYLTPEGKILQHNWLDVPYILKINPAIDPKTINKTNKIETPLRDCWMEDVEMLSKYLDRKSSMMVQKTEYLTDHPDIKHLIADYTQTLLVGNQFLNWINFVPILLRQVTLMKPMNVIDFTIQHFKAFAKDPQTWETSSLEECYDLDLKSQLAKEKSEIVCSVCGFCIDSTTIEDPFPTTSMGHCSEAEFQNYRGTPYSTDSKYLSDTTDCKSCSASTSTSESINKKCVRNEVDRSNFLSQLRKTCKDCCATVKACQRDTAHAKCPGCLKKFSVCVNCSTFDKNMKK